MLLLLVIPAKAGIQRLGFSEKGKDTGSLLDQPSAVEQHLAGMTTLLCFAIFSQAGHLTAD
jgi:hypothetical protein